MPVSVAVARCYECRFYAMGQGFANPGCGPRCETSYPNAAEGWKKKGQVWSAGYRFCFPDFLTSAQREIQNEKMRIFLAQAAAAFPACRVGLR